MVRLIFGELAANARVWAGTVLICAATAAVGTVAAAQIQTAVALGGPAGLALYVISGTVLAFGALAAVVVLGSVTGLTVALQQRDYALWQLVGVGPGRVRLIVTAQLLVAGLLGAAAGCAATVPALPALFRFFFADASGLGPVRPAFGLPAAGAVVLFVLVVALTGGARGARRASRTAPIELLREPAATIKGMSFVRWVLGSAAAALAVTMAITLPGPDRIETPLMVLPPLVAGVLAAFGPLYLARLIRAWTGLIPSFPWYLARNIAVGQASISPLVVAIALAGGLYAAHGTAAAGWSSAHGTPAAGLSSAHGTAAAGLSSAHGTAAAGGALSAGTVTLLIGGPLLVSVLGAAVTVLMSSRGREREFALIRAAGGTPGTVLKVAVAEAVIYVATATVLGFTAVAASAAAGAVAARVVPSFGLAAIGVVSGAGLLLMLAATVAPTVLALRRPVAASLAAE